MLELTSSRGGDGGGLAATLLVVFSLIGSVPAEAGVPAPTLTTQVSGTSVCCGLEVIDTATLAGAVDPTGTITFNLHGPGDDTCSAPPVFTSIVFVSGNGSYDSASFHAVPVGTYRFVATYSGDANNAPITTACGDPTETFDVGPFATFMRTFPSGPTTVGGSLTDTAQLDQTNNATGTITFTLYGPDDPTCAAPPLLTTVIPVAGPGPYTSDPFTATAPGTYHWTVDYSGDAGNQPFTSTCGDATVVSKAASLIDIDAASSGTVGQPVLATAMVLGPAVPITGPLGQGTRLSTALAELSVALPTPTGAVTFTVFGPDDSECAGPPAFTSIVPVAGGPPATATSGPFTPSAAGIYRWVAAYSGDANYEPATTACDDPSGVSTVATAPVEPPPIPVDEQGPATPGARPFTQTPVVVVATSPDRVLARTGGDSAVSATLALWLISAGGIVVLAGRTRRHI